MQAKGIASVRSRVCNLKDYLPGYGSLDELQEALQRILSDGDAQMELPPEDIRQVELMAETKFSTWDFIYGHSREADFSRKAKLPCGTVEAAFKLDHGRICSLTFYGDYLFDEPSGELARRLEGKRFEASEIMNVLKEADVPSYFQGTSVEDLVSGLFGLA